MFANKVFYTAVHNSYRTQLRVWQPISVWSSTGSRPSTPHPEFLLLVTIPGRRVTRHNRIPQKTKQAITCREQECYS